MRIPDVFDRYDADEQDGPPPFPERTVKCKHCGSTEVRWRYQTGKWTLFSLKPGILHFCDKPSAQDDFK